MYVLVVGNPFDGLDLVGPFEDPDEASVWAVDEYKNDTWWVMEVTLPGFVD
ncbi:hypothetical protein LCGC14_1616170 [marine sediment metagenome]|uniref:Uncharacterized protein n=1 Tax=marine sediment metagenome TaxID=412755 RepID=A0A0F9I6V3_9ZZZZ